jgi:hypothetical protein
MIIARASLDPATCNRPQPPGLSGMTRFIRQQIKQAIAEDELWVARARTLIEPDVDRFSIEQSIARPEATRAVPALGDVPRDVPNGVR